MVSSASTSDWYDALITACNCGDVGVTEALACAVQRDHVQVIQWLYSDHMTPFVPWNVAQLLVHTAKTALECDNQEVLDILFSSLVFKLHVSEAEQQNVLNELLADAVRKENGGMINLMIGLGAQVNTEDRQTLLCCASTTGIEVHLLVDSGMFVVGEVVEPGYLGDVVSAVSVLADYGLDFGWSHTAVLHEAIQYHNAYLVEAIVQQPVVDLDPLNEDNMTPLLLLTMRLCSMIPYDGLRGETADMIMTLIESGADVNAKSPQGDTALDFTILTPQSELVLEMLLEAGACVDDISSSFPMSDLAAYCQEESLTILLQHGCDPRRLDRRGNSLYDRLVAVSWGKTFVEKMPHLFSQPDSEATNEPFE